ncbi:MAG: TM0106 family RecB-like putative nuclease, partial [Microbacteriaceae bacterium]|nr:TM0106 family RecB-like putative nuclease [Microbacteriaceae bacterium]
MSTGKRNLLVTVRLVEEFELRVSKLGKWAFASRDVFAAVCEHCTRLDMAVAARVPEILARVEPYKVDLSKKVHIIQGNEYEDAIFSELAASVDADDFLEFDRSNQSLEATLEALRAGIPLVAQAMFVHEFGDFEWMGYADLLVREDYELEIGASGKLVAVKGDGRDALSQVSAASAPKYVVWDVKYAKAASAKYWKQIAGYAEVLEFYGLASTKPLGVLLSGRQVARNEYDASVSEMQQARATLFQTLSLVSSAEISADFAPMTCCATRSVCEDIFCSFPDLCAKVRYEQDSLEQLPGGLPQHRAALNAAGIFTTAALAEWPAGASLENLTDPMLTKYIAWAKVIQAERVNGPTVSKIANPFEVGLPNLDDGDLFFDIEWFNPLGQEELIFMFGVVDSKEDFTAFLADDAEQERTAFEQFVEFATNNLRLHPESHIFHYSDPEPGRLRKLAARYGVLIEEVEVLVSSMVDLKRVAKASIMPGCAG